MLGKSGRELALWYLMSDGLPGCPPPQVMLSKYPLGSHFNRRVSIWRAFGRSHHWGWCLTNIMSWSAHLWSLTCPGVNTPPTNFPSFLSVLPPKWPPLLHSAAPHCTGWHWLLHSSAPPPPLASCLIAADTLWLFFNKQTAKNLKYHDMPCVMQKKTQGKMQVQTQCRVWAIVSPFVTCAFDLVWILKILGKVEIIDGRHLEEEVKEKEGVSHMWVCLLITLSNVTQTLLYIGVGGIHCLDAWFAQCFVFFWKYW